MSKNNLGKYRFYTLGPWQDPEEQEEIIAAFYAAVAAGERRIALEWSWCGGSNIDCAVDGRGRHWESYNGRRRRLE